MGHNMFAYCGNNPVNRRDDSGRFWEWVVIAGLVVGLLTGCSQQEEPTYTSEEIAAFDAGVKVREYTNKDNHEYICGIYRTNTGEYLAGSYYKGNHASVSYLEVLEESKEYSDRSLVALVHSHPYCSGHIPNEFSKYIRDENGEIYTYGDLLVSAETGLSIYLAAPDGNLYVMRAINPTTINGHEIWGHETRLVKNGLPKDETLYICGG